MLIIRTGPDLHQWIFFSQNQRNFWTLEQANGSSWAYKIKTARRREKKYLPVNKCGNFTGKITASFKASLAPLRPATSSHETLGFSTTMAPASIALCVLLFVTHHWVKLPSARTTCIWVHCGGRNNSPLCWEPRPAEGSLKPGVGQNIAMHASPTARNFFTSNFHLPGPFNFICSKSSLPFSYARCG